MASLPSILSSAHRLDLASYVEHETGCPDWYRDLQIDNAATRDRRCDCGLTEQLAAVEMLAEFVRDLLGQERPDVPAGAQADRNFPGVVWFRNTAMTPGRARCVAVEMLRAAEAAEELARAAEQASAPTKEG